ncbi:hypothetical protein LD780_22570, partial [Salmonella enterica]|nr:hypothetical protein [Salmonella enterica]
HFWMVCVLLWMKYWGAICKPGGVLTEHDIHRARRMRRDKDIPGQTTSGSTDVVQVKSGRLLQSGRGATFR